MNLFACNYKIEIWFQKLIIKYLYNTKALKFSTWKSPTHYEQYTKVELFGKKINEIRWSEIEMVTKLK